MQRVMIPRSGFMLLLMSLCFFSLNAQIINTDKIRFGKISDTEMELTSYAPDPEAEAVILFDEGRLRMGLDPETNTFEYLLDRHIRIKILNASATDYATFSFLLEKEESSFAQEELVNPKGATYNLANGKLEESKLTKDGIFKEKINDHLTRVIITFPQVKEGSLIELKYTIKSDFIYNLPTWYFQREIPIDYSHYEAVIPEYYSYNLDMKGYASNTLIENVIGRQGEASIFLKGATKRWESTNRSNIHSSSDGGHGKIDFVTSTYRWTALEVPTLKGELFAPQARNFFFRIDFELASVNTPGAVNNSVTHSWENVHRTYLFYSNNRPYLKPSKDMEALAQRWAGSAKDEQSKMIAIYEAIKQNVNWNGNFRPLASSPPKQLLELKQGSSADLNYFLIAALRSVGINADPVLVSTRKNGYLSINRPSLSQFNHVITSVHLTDGTSFLLDATKKDIPVGLLPIFDLVEKGRLITSDTSNWVDIVVPANEKTAVQLKLSLTKAGLLSGEAGIKSIDYAAIDLRRKIENESDMAAYVQKWLQLETSEVEVKNLTDPYQDINIQAQVNATNYLTQQGDFYYVQAIIAKRFTENPFKAETRVLPIDLVKPQEFVYVMSLELEEGLQLEEIPESVSFTLPGGKARYSLRFVDINGDLQLIEKLTINEPIFGADEYAALKNFLDLVIENQQVTLVVKKGE